MKNKGSKKNKLYKKAGICFILTIPFLLTSCNGHFDKSLYAFSTLLSITYEGKDGATLKELNILFNKYNNLFDPYTNYDSTKNIYDLNTSRRLDNPDEGIKEILEMALDIKEKTNGYFNPLTFNVNEAWKKYIHGEREILSSEEMATFANSILSTKLEINNSITLKDGNESIDLGGIAKGYVLDKAKDIFNKNQVKTYLINAGSSSILIGEKTNGDAYSVGLGNFKNKYIKLKNCALGTSAISSLDNSENYKKMGDKIYSHIVNPITGSSEIIHDFCTVFGPKAAICDALSTVCIIMNVNQIKELNTIFPDYHFICSKDNNFTLGSEYVLSK